MFRLNDKVFFINYFPFESAIREIDINKPMKTKNEDDDEEDDEAGNNMRE